MLTEAEKKWLEKRSVESCETCRTPRKFCILCLRSEICGALAADMFSLSGLELFVFEKGYRDAAEFEARVAEKLARNTHPVPCIEHGCPHKMPTVLLCEPCRLKYTRLAVEAEMEKE